MSDLPLCHLSADDEAQGRVATLQAAAAAVHGPVVNGLVPNRLHAGPCAFLVGAAALEFAYGAGRGALSSAAGWLPLIGRRFGRAVLNSDEPDHAVERRAWAPAFSTSALARCVPLMDAVIARRIERWTRTDTIDAYAATRELSLAVIANVMADLPDDDRLAALSRAFTYVLDGPRPGESLAEQYARLAPVRDHMEAQLLRLLREAHGRGGNCPGLVGILLRDRPDMPLSALAEQVNILLVAGHETTAVLLAWMLVLLAQQPQWQERVQREMAPWTTTLPTIDVLESMTATDAFVAEVGRLYAPLVNVPRVAARDFEFGGVRVPAGHRVALAIGATHRLASHEQPETFRPERFLQDRPVATFTFGTGARYCLGVRFARLEAKLLLRRLLAGKLLRRDRIGGLRHAGFWNARPAGDASIRLATRDGAQRADA